MEDTIVAISTAIGVGAISIIRVSGSEAIKKVSEIFKGKDLNKVPTHTIHYGKIYDNDNIIDEVLVTVMKSPKTFTTEDTVEINCHGGIASTNKVLELLLTNGCRLAEPGEFTKRAFLNGRIDLTEAEGVMDLINAKTDKTLELAINQVSGKVSKMIRNLRQLVKEVIANIEVNIDYPEYEDIEVITLKQLKTNIGIVEDKIKKILSESKNGQLIKNGIKTAIVGRPNVGKSSILNLLLDEEKAIVTDIAGTTRDIVEGTITIDGITLDVIDTAGIRNTDNVVESIGVKKSFEMIEKAQLVLFVLNNNDLISDDDFEILEKIKNKNYIIIINKSDLIKKIDTSKLPENNIIYMSAIKEEGLNQLKDKIKEMFNLEKIETEDMTYLTSARSISILNKSLIIIENIRKGIENNIPIEILEIDLKEIWSILGEIIGETYQEELIDQLFSQFCLGK